MHRNTLRLAQLLICCFVTATTGAALAVDGVIEINQTSAGVTGFPVAITASGSYRLTSNLNPPAGTGAIVVSSSSVEIDLNGFSVIGGGGAAVPGIQALGAISGLVVRNGNVTGFSGPAIIAGPQSKLLQLRIATNGGGGILSAFDCLIEDSVISDNTLPPAIGAFGCKIENNVIEGNTGNAIQGDLNVIVHNRIFGNSGTGILSPGGRSMIAENAISQNGLDGVDCGPGCTIKGNTVINNGDTGVTVAGGGSNVVGNTMSFNGTVGLLIDVLSAFSNNNMNGNAGAEKVPAAHPTDAFDNICGGAAC